MPVTGNGRARVIRDESGQYAVITLLLLSLGVVLIGMIADIGRAYAVRRLLQNSVDTAAQAAAQQVDHGFSGREVRLHISAAMGTAYQYLYPQCSGGGAIESVVISVDPTTNAVQVFARARARCVFMRLVGIREMRISAVGRAVTEWGLNQVGQ